MKLLHISGIFFLLVIMVSGCAPEMIKFTPLPPAPPFEGKRILLVYDGPTCDGNFRQTREWIPLVKRVVADSFFKWKAKEVTNHPLHTGEVSIAETSPYDYIANVCLSYVGNGSIRYSQRRQHLAIVDIEVVNRLTHEVSFRSSGSLPFSFSAGQCGICGNHPSDAFWVAAECAVRKLGGQSQCVLPKS